MYLVDDNCKLETYNYFSGFCNAGDYQQLVVGKSCLIQT